MADAWPSPEVVTFAFTGMVNLRILTFERVSSIDSLLPFVAHAPVLTLLSIVASAARDLDCPSPVVLRDLLTACPALHCTVSMPDDMAFDSSSLVSFEPRMRLVR